MNKVFWIGSFISFFVMGTSNPEIKKSASMSQQVDEEAIDEATEGIDGKIINVSQALEPPQKKNSVQFEAQFWPGAGWFQRPQLNGTVKPSNVAFTPPLFFYFAFPVGGATAFTLGVEWLLADRMTIIDHVMESDKGELTTSLNNLSLLLGFSFGFRDDAGRIYGHLHINAGPVWITWKDRSFLKSEGQNKFIDHRQDHFGIVGNIAYRHEIFQLWDDLGFFMGPSFSAMWSNGWGVYGGINVGITTG